MRAHAEFKTKRREPWLFGDEITRQVRVALRLRYTLLPYLYTLFAQHAADGALVMRPLCLGLGLGFGFGSGLGLRFGFGLGC